MAKASFYTGGELPRLAQRHRETRARITRDTSFLLRQTSPARMPGAGEPRGCQPTTSRNYHSSLSTKRNGAMKCIRPPVLFADRTPQQRAHETDTHPATVRALTRRFRGQGMLGLLPGDVEVIVRARTPRVPEAVRQELDRLKALYDGFHYRKQARIVFVTCGVPIDHKTVKVLWQQSPVSGQGHLGLWDYHAQPDRYHARLQVVQLYYRGWDKVSISRFLHVSRPTVDAGIQCFETEHFAGLMDKSPAPHVPVR